MKFQIKSLAGSVLFEGDFSSLAKCVEAAVSARANLAGANLAGANLAGAYLADAYLAGANLADAYLAGAYLAGANLAGANLADANLARANLAGANLADAYLAGANLADAYLARANLADAYLADAKNAELAIARTRILPAGSLIVWKQLQGDAIAKLRIPEEAKRSHAFGRKCRAEFADVVEIVNSEGKPVKSGTSHHDSSFKYRVGERVQPTDKFSDDWQVECASGIHFYLTREEAVAHS